MTQLLCHKEDDFYGQLTDYTLLQVVSDNISAALACHGLPAFPLLLEIE